MDVRRIDPFDDAVLARYHDVCRRAELHERPWESFLSLPELRARFEHPNSGERSELHAAFDGDELVGGCFADFPLHDNTDKVYVHVMVAPEHRRRGAGSLLVDHLAALARTQGRSMLLAESSYRFEDRESHPYRRFMEKNGFTLAYTEVVRVLALPVAEEVLDRLSAAAAPHHTGYRVETFVDDVPDRLLPSYCHLYNQLVLDAPTGNLDFEEESLTPEVFLQTAKRLRSSGQTRLTALALTAEDEVVAFSDLVVKADPAQRVQQWGTLVHRGHRGHRLGTAVKVANVRVLQERFPDRTAIGTSNAEVNPTMVGINDQLGFRPVAVLPMFQRTL